MSVSNEAPITATEVRTWFKALHSNDAPRQIIQNHFDENVEWWSNTPGDGPLGRTTPISGKDEGFLLLEDVLVNGVRSNMNVGRVVGMKAWMDRGVIPLEAPFADPLTGKYSVGKYESGSN